MSIVELDGFLRAVEEHDTPPPAHGTAFLATLWVFLTELAYAIQKALGF